MAPAEPQIRAAQHGIEIQAAVEQGITDWCNLASTPPTIDTAGAESFSTFLPDGQWESFRSVAADRSVSLIQGLAQAVQLWLGGNPAPHVERPTIIRRVVVCNQKGGVGKTAITAGTGEALAEDPNTLHPVRVAKALTKALRASATRADESEPAGDDPLDIENLPGPGLRVLLVDFDPQCHLTNQLGANPLPMNGDSLTNHMAGDPKGDLRDLIVSIDDENFGGRLHLLPACNHAFLLVTGGLGVMADLRQWMSEGKSELPRVGRVVRAAGLFPPYVVLAGDGTEIEPVAEYLKELALSDASVLTPRSYGYDLLRWFRLLLCTSQADASASAVADDLPAPWMSCR